jgi:hypothetical protein
MEECMTKGNRLDTAQPPRKFGMFYPRGYVIVAFKGEDDASRVRQQLIDGGYDEDDVLLMDTAQVLEGSTADLEHLSPLIRALGSEPDLMEGHRAGAEAGQTFLIAYAPSDLDAQRLMNVARRQGYLRAQKYDRFSFTEL